MKALQTCLGIVLVMALTGAQALTRSGVAAPDVQASGKRTLTIRMPSDPSARQKVSQSIRIWASKSTERRSRKPSVRGMSPILSSASAGECDAFQVDAWACSGDVETLALVFEDLFKDHWGRDTWVTFTVELPKPPETPEPPERLPDVIVPTYCYVNISSPYGGGRVPCSDVSSLMSDAGFMELGKGLPQAAVLEKAVEYAAAGAEYLVRKLAHCAKVFAGNPVNTFDKDAAREPKYWVAENAIWFEYMGNHSLLRPGYQVDVQYPFGHAVTFMITAVNSTEPKTMSLLPMGFAPADTPCKK